MIILFDFIDTLSERTVLVGRRTSLVRNKKLGAHLETTLSGAFWWSPLVSIPDHHIFSPPPPPPEQCVWGRTHTYIEHKNISELFTSTFFSHGLLLVTSTVSMASEPD